MPRKPPKIYVTRDPTVFKNDSPREINAKYLPLPDDGVWPDNYIAYCTGCAVWHWRGCFNSREMNGRFMSRPRCRDFETVKDQIKGPNKSIPSKGAYTHIIRDDATQKFYRLHILDCEVPKGYTIIHKTRAGLLLPRSFWRYPVYDPQSNV